MVLVLIVVNSIASNNFHILAVSKACGIIIKNYLHSKLLLCRSSPARIIIKNYLRSKLLLMLSFSCQDYHKELLAFEVAVNVVFFVSGLS